MWLAIGRFVVAMVLGFKVAALAVYLGMPAYNVDVLGRGVNLTRIAVFLIAFNLIRYGLTRATAEEKPAS